MTQTIGQRLKAEREAQKLTLEKVFEVTRIRVPYLQALERDDLSSVPSPVQARGYLRNYAEYLGLDFQELLDEMRVTAQDTSGEVIGPADEVTTLPHSARSQDDTSVITQTPETDQLDHVHDTPLSEDKETNLPESKPSSALSGTVRSPTPSRQGRMQGRGAQAPENSDMAQEWTGSSEVADSQPESASVESAPKRRGRKKFQLQPKRILVDEPEPFEIMQARPDSAESPNDQVESIGQPQPGAVQADGDNSLWQRWLNRLGSVLSARMKRRTFVPREPSSSADDPGAAFSQLEVLPADDALQVPAETQNLALQRSTEIFKEIGVQLRERRELLSLHLDEVERNTHVKAHYLGALERGAMDELPSTVQTRGMLSNYATFLDMDVDALLLRFADALQARHRERNPQKPARKPGQPIIASVPPIRTFIAGDIIFGIGMAVLLVGFAIWGVSRVVELQSQEEMQPTAPSISDVLLATPNPSELVATPTLQPVEAFPDLATVTIVIPTQNVNVEVQVNLVATERTYMRVVVDGEVAFDGRVVPGNAYPFQAENQIEVLVGNGAAIRTVYNGRDLGLMGTFGQVVGNIYTANEIITPTALPSPSPTNTEPPTATAPPTATIGSTNTGSPSNTPVP